MCKKILRLLIIFAVFLLKPSYGQTFSACDLERLLGQHPMMKDYQEKTGRFANTPSEIVPMERVLAQIASAQAEISLFTSRREELLAGSLEATENPDEMSLWLELTRLADEIKARKARLAELEELQATNGVPPVSRVLPIARKILLDTREKFPEADIVVNYLPRFLMPPPKFDGNPLRDFYFEPEKVSFISKYLAQRSRVGLMFQNLSRPILVGERKSDYEKK